MDTSFKDNVEIEAGYKKSIYYMHIGWKQNNNPVISKKLNKYSKVSTW